MIKHEPPQEPAPSVRQNAEKRWPHGVLSGGTVIDMLEYLSQTGTGRNYVYVRWLLKEYILPFGRIDRLDGLVVKHEDDLYVYVLVLVPSQPLLLNHATTR